MALTFHKDEIKKTAIENKPKRSPAIIQREIAAVKEQMKKLQSELEETNKNTEKEK